MAATMEVGSWFNTPAMSNKDRVWIRECYSDVYTDIRELASVGKRYIHISGDPGIGKSCFLWYVLRRLLDDGETAVIVELLVGITVNTFVFKQDGSCDAEDSPDYNRPGVWLLTDEAFVGHRAWNGTTVLFASPEKDKWIQAEKTMRERKFTTLYMPPWSVDELQAVYFSDPENEGEYMEFWAKYYVAGPIIRHYVTPLIKVLSEKLTAVEKVVDGGVLNATLLKAHEIFVSWPTLDFTRVDHFSFASEWAADCFAIACFNGQIKNWIASTLFLAANRSLRSAAGVLFERVAHYRLSMGGDFCSIDDPTRKLHLEKREVKYFSGNSLDLQIPGLYYLQPSSTSFPVIDSVYPPLVLFQISIATKQRPMKKCDYDALCSSLMAFRNEHPDIPSGLEGVPEPNRVHAILVKMEGDNAKHSQRLCMVEDTPEDAPANETAPHRSARKRARTQRSISKVKQGETAGVMKKRTFLPFQMTIALKMDHTVPDTLDYPSLQQIHDIVCARMDGAVDTGARKFGDIKKEEADFARVLMRQGKGSIQYEEEMDGVPVFGAWIEAVRTKEGSDSVEKTVLTIQCTAGKLAGRELTLFVNERLLPDKEFSNPLVLNMLRLEAVSGADDAAYQVCWSGATASVVIRSNRRASRKLMLVFPAEQTEEEEDDYKEEDYMEI